MADKAIKFGVLAAALIFLALESMVGKRGDASASS